ncbi:hypothetical protein DFH08DRAFT_905126, partial [Mycena albidolilacea]
MAAQRCVSALCLSSAIADQLTPALPVQLIIVHQPLLSRWSYSEGREQHRGGGAHEMWRLAGGFFSGGRGADTEVPIGCTCAQRRSCAHWRDSTI